MLMKLRRKLCPELCRASTRISRTFDKVCDKVTERKRMPHAPLSGGGLSSALRQAASGPSLRGPEFASQTGQAEEAISGIAKKAGEVIMELDSPNR